MNKNTEIVLILLGYVIVCTILLLLANNYYTNHVSIKTKCHNDCTENFTGKVDWICIEKCLKLNCS